MSEKKVLVVNDSPVLTAVIRAIVETSEQLRVVAVASNGLEAIGLVPRYLPDLVLMDIHMPKMGGVEATRKIIQARAKTRILITSATLSRNMKHIFDALQSGAIDYVRSPSLSFSPGTEVSRSQLTAAGAEMMRKIHTVLRISEHKVEESQVMRRAVNGQRESGTVTELPHDSGNPWNVGQRPMLAIGCSTGGPTTLAMLLSGLQRPFPVPVLVCQHIDREFTVGFVNWLTEQTGMAVTIARSRTLPVANQVYVAPGGRINLEVSSSGRLMLVEPQPDQIYLPNINQLFFSMARHLGPAACGIVLTGMGDDGAAGAAVIQQAGGVALAQDLSSAVVDSMPRATLQSLGTTIAFPPQLLAARVNQHFAAIGSRS